MTGTEEYSFLEIALALILSAGGIGGHLLLAFVVALIIVALFIVPMIDEVQFIKYFGLKEWVKDKRKRKK